MHAHTLKREPIEHLFNTYQATLFEWLNAINTIIKHYVVNVSNDVNVFKKGSLKCVENVHFTS